MLGAVNQGHAHPVIAKAVIEQISQSSTFHRSSKFNLVLSHAETDSVLNSTSRQCGNTHSHLAYLRKNDV